MVDDLTGELGGQLCLMMSSGAGIAAICAEPSCNSTPRVRPRARYPRVDPNRLFGLTIRAASSSSDAALDRPGDRPTPRSARTRRAWSATLLGLDLRWDVSLYAAEALESGSGSQPSGPSGQLRHLGLETRRLRGDLHRPGQSRDHHRHIVQHVFVLVPAAASCNPRPPTILAESDVNALVGSLSSRTRSKCGKATNSRPEVVVVERRGAELLPGPPDEAWPASLRADAGAEGAGLAAGHG